MATTPRWWRDPVLGLGLAVAIGTTAYVVFAGRYLPYTDWAGHVGNAAVLAYGDETGADAYLARDFRPTPYLLFYLLTAAWSAVTSVEVGAKLNLLLIAGGLVVGAARLAAATGRSPRLALLAPLALWGESLGHGFSSFVAGLPFVPLALADLEHGLAGRGRAAWVRFALWLGLAFLSHGLVFVFVALLVAARVAVHLATARGAAVATLRALALSVLPSVGLAVPSILRRLPAPYVAPEFYRPEGPVLWGAVPLATRWATLPGDLLDRGGAHHTATFVLVALAIVGLFVAGAWRRAAARAPGPIVYFAVATGVFLLGPVHLGWPVTFWVVYQRAGSLALLFLGLLPTAALTGRRGLALCALALLPVLHNAFAQAEVVREFDAWARPYDLVRAAIPGGQRILPLSERQALGRVRYQASESLGAYHLVDGAAWVPIGPIPEEMPVHRLNTPETPPIPPAMHLYDPLKHGARYDYVVIRGAGLRRLTEASGRFERVPYPGDAAGDWAIYRNRFPPPQPP